MRNTLLSKIDNFSPNVLILFSIVAILVTIGLIFLLISLIKKNITKLKDESNSITEQALSRTAMRESIEYYIAKVGSFGLFSMIYVDVDDFAGLNDLLGREQCDKLLVEIANKICKLLPYKGSICRYQKDEFLIFIKDDYSKDELEDLAKSINETINEPFSILREEELTIGASIGIASYPTCGSTFKELITNLELATYVSKRGGGNMFTSYYSQLSEVESANMEYFKEVKDAIKNKEFCLYYHPMIDLRKNQIFAFECLIRWNHPVHGILPPFKFINILEQSGDINWVGEWGLEQMVKQIAYFKTNYPNEKIKLSMNLSTKQLLDEKIAESFRKITKKYRVENSDIILEIAEFAMYDKMNQIKINLLRLKDYGFIIAVDGFSLDYSTLSQIEHEPIDIIKLDREFLEDTNNNFMKEKFVNMLVDFTRTNNCFVISEGVENQQMVDYIISHGIEYAQGYFYSKPMADSELDDFIRFRKWDDHSEVGTEPAINKPLLNDKGGMDSDFDQASFGIVKETINDVDINFEFEKTKMSKKATSKKSSSVIESNEEVKTQDQIVDKPLSKPIKKTSSKKVAQVNESGDEE